MNKKILLTMFSVVILSSIIALTMVQAQQMSLKKKITDLPVGWSIIGTPYNHVVEKTDVMIRYGGDCYTWGEAVADNLIVDDVFGWDRATQTYELITVFEPGYGYWIYSYVDCVLYLKK